MFHAFLILAQLASPLPVAPVSTPTPAKLGPVLVDGRAVATVSFLGGDSQTVSVTQPRAPAGTYFTASPGTLCAGAVRIAGGPSRVPRAGISSTGPFTITRLSNATGCTITISSSAGGPPAAVMLR